MSRVKIRQFGLDEMDAHFQALSTLDQKKLIIRTLKTSVEPMERMMRFMAPEKSLKESIGTVQLRKMIGVKTGARVDRGKKGHFGVILDRGTDERYRYTRNNAPTGRIKAYKWFSESVARTEDLVNKRVVGEHYAAMQKIMSRHVRKVNKEFISSEFSPV